MKKFISIFVLAVISVFILLPNGTAQAGVNQCRSNADSFFGIPTWDMYLDATKNADGSCDLKINDISDIWLIVIAIIDILVRLSSIIAVIFVIYGGIDMSLSRGNPEKIGKARGTIINALIGLVITVSGTQLISFMATRIGG